MTQPDGGEQQCKHEVTTQRFHFYQVGRQHMSWWCSSCGALFLHDEVKLPVDHAAALKVGEQWQDWKKLNDLTTANANEWKRRAEQLQSEIDSIKAESATLVKTISKLRKLERGEEVVIATIAEGVIQEADRRWHNAEHKAEQLEARLKEEAQRNMKNGQRAMKAEADVEVLVERDEMLSDALHRKALKLEQTEAALRVAVEALEYCANPHADPTPHCYEVQVHGRARQALAHPAIASLRGEK